MRQVGKYSYTKSEWGIELGFIPKKLVFIPSYLECNYDLPIVLPIVLRAAQLLIDPFHHLEYVWNVRIYVSIYLSIYLLSIYISIYAEYTIFNSSKANDKIINVLITLTEILLSIDERSLKEKRENYTAIKP